MRIAKTGEEKAIGVVVYTLLALFALSTLYPFVNILAKAFSSYEANITGNVFMWPRGFQTQTMLNVVGKRQFWMAFWVSLRVAGIGTLLSLTVSGAAAYALSRPRLRGRTALTVLFVFTMMFSGGMVPTYLVIRSLKLINKLASIYLPAAVSVYNLLIMKSAFESVPPSLEESALIDGASNFTVFRKIMLPVVMPTLAAVSLFLAVGFWNEYWSAMLYITSNDLKPIQLYLLDIVNFAMDTSNINSAEGIMALTDAPQAIRAATIIATTIPVLLLYPFVQKYFVKGVMIGSVKE